MAFVLNRTSGPIVSRRLLQRVITTAASEQQYRFRSELPYNTVILFVRQQEAWVVERMGKFYKILNPGLNFLLPFVDKIRHRQLLAEIAIEIPRQKAVSKDNVTLTIDGVLYVKIFDPYLASYGVEDVRFAIEQLAQTTMRSEIGKIALDTLFRDRELLNVGIVEAINKAAKAWGLDCLRYETREIEIPPKVQEAMQKQVEAEREKRATILRSEGDREAQINYATGQAEAIRAKANARAEALQVISDRLQSEEGRNAASLEIAEQYVHAFGNLARTNNTILLPSNTGDMSSMIASALAIYSNVHSKDGQGFVSQSTTTSQTSPSSSTPVIESSPLPPGSKPTNDLSSIRRAKKPTTEKDTQ